MKKGTFIVFEGLDGNGKTTQVKLLEQYFKDKGLKVTTTREPGGTPTGEKIREILLNKDYFIKPLTELFLFEAARAQLVSAVIKPALAENRIVISDRYGMSSLAYQGYGRNIKVKFIEKLNKLATENLEPDIYFYLDIPPKEGLDRKGRKEELPLFSPRMEREEEDFYQRVRKGYLKLVEQNSRAISIEARLTPEEISVQVIRALKEKFDL
jgi:dTMP kinase